MPQNGDFLMNNQKFNKVNSWLTTNGEQEICAKWIIWKITIKFAMENCYGKKLLIRVAKLVWKSRHTLR